jgi:hypothetical protein
MVIKPFHRNPYLVKELDYIEQSSKEPNNREILLDDPIPPQP